MSVGLLLGAERDRSSADPTPQDTTPTTATRTPATSPPPSGSLCRDETQAAARRAGAPGPLVRVLRLRTKTSEVYICRDPAGALYYHANSDENSWIEGETALFLTGVTGEGDHYEVTATDGTTFSVTAKRLLIVHTDGSKEPQPAVR
ncbi:hypothetical protein AB0M20_28165 [Actinoplanes sp. NPDC051633]|uniref:hypothetical protein n=1 Tax=Actinoplanes sp. NPDC051633 TaxID=3155670 RepID=UPI003442A246